MTNIFTGLKKNTIDLRNNVSKVNNELKRQQDSNKRYKYCRSNTTNIITFNNNNLQIIEDGSLVLERSFDNGFNYNILHNYFSKQLLNNKVINRYSLFLLENNQYIEYMNLKKGNELKSGVIVSDNKKILDFIIEQLTYIYGYEYDNNLQYLLNNVLVRK